MTTSKKLLAQAAAEVGYREGAGNSNKYGAWYGLNEQDWCLIFICWCAHSAGISGTVIPKMAWCPAFMSWFEQQGRLILRGSGQARPGDIVFFDNNGNGVCDHVGIVEQWTAGKLHTIEGNRANSVARAAYRQTDEHILGYGRPKYQQEDEQMQIQKKKVYINGRERELHMIFIEGENFPALREIVAALGGKVDYRETEKRIEITI
ncbi:MAG: CHAP domain-containing protein [Bacillota bacterium]|nr:CHAP domain-containing protein [Bacillota bacterium]